MGGQEIDCVTRDSVTSGKASRGDETEAWQNAMDGMLEINCCHLNCEDI